MALPRLSVQSEDMSPDEAPVYSISERDEKLFIRCPVRCQPLSPSPALPEGVGIERDRAEQWETHTRSPGSSCLSEGSAAGASSLAEELQETGSLSRVLLCVGDRPSRSGGCLCRLSGVNLRNLTFFGVHRSCLPNRSPAEPSLGTQGKKYHLLVIMY